MADARPRVWVSQPLFADIVGRLDAHCDVTVTPQVLLFVTGGGSKLVAEVLSENASLAVRHVPHLVLSGIALVDAAGK